MKFSLELSKQNMHQNIPLVMYIIEISEMRWNGV